LPIEAYKRTWRDIFRPTLHKEKKRPKKKESLLKLPQLWKSTKVAFGDSFLMISSGA
jgi:hypothetical protein